MKQFWIIGISYLLFGNISADHDDLTFPPGLDIGAGSASYQIEGAWNVSDKGEGVWDRWTHTNSTEGINGDIAADFYHHYKEDVQRVKSIGFQFFRFSISWSRVLPTGFSNVISEDGLNFYKNLIAELLANGIEPIVTLNHFDQPQILEEYGGWTNEAMVDWFVSYARIMFRELGGSVKIWSTVNEPDIYCTLAYDSGGILAPGKNLAGRGKYLCMHNMLKAHAKTYHMYDKEFRATQHGEIGIVSNCGAHLPLNSDDTESVDTAFEFNCGWSFHPIYNGDYPKIMKKRIAMVSEAQGYERSRLPEFSNEWISLIKGTADYFGLNHYSSNYVSPDPDEALGIYKTDNGLIESVDPSWPETKIFGLTVYAPGFGIILRQIKDKYGNPPIRVMENGYSDLGEINDYDRIQFHYDYLKEMLTAVNKDGCNVKSYSIWSLLDDFEWNSGYTPKFGIFSVDFNDTNRSRTARLSASWWKSVLDSRNLQPVPARNKCNA